MLLLNNILVLLIIYTEHADTSLLLKARNQFQEYNLVIHYDNRSFRDLADLVLANTKETYTYLINYDTIDKPLPTKGYNFLHIVLLKNPLRFSVPSLVRYKVNVRDRVLIVDKSDANDTVLLEICEQNGPYGAGGVFVLGTLHNSISSCCYFCNRRKVSLRTVNVTNENISELRQFVNNFTNFGGYLFRIGFSQYEPFFYCKREDYQCIMQGSEFNLLKTLSQELNFRYKLVDFSGYYYSGAWENMLEEVRYKKIDWAVSGISQNPVRSKNVAFTKYITHQGYMVIFSVHDNQWLAMIQFLHVVFISNWMILIILGLAVIGIVFVTKLSLTLFNKNNKSETEYTFMPLVYLVEQHSSRLQTRNTWKPCVKILFFLWWFVCCCLTTYYKTQQAYVLMSSSTNPANIDEMVDRGFKFLIYDEDWPYLNANSRRSSLQVFTNVMNAADIVSDPCGSIMRVSKNTIGFIQEEAPLQFLALKQCNLTINQKYRLRFVPVYPIPREWHAWPMQKSTPFVNAFSRMFSRLEASGLLQFWYAENIRRFHSILRSDQAGYLRTETNPLNLYHFLFPFVILVVGYCLSVVVCLIEVGNTRFKYK